MKKITIISLSLQLLLTLSLILILNKSALTVVNALLLNKATPFRSYSLSSSPSRQGNYESSSTNKRITTHSIKSLSSSLALSDVVHGDEEIKQQFWKWRNHDIFTEVKIPSSSVSSRNSFNKPKVILIHGFGASTTYWRETMKRLQNEGFEVHALDLLGQGRSSKPVPSPLKDGDDDDDEGCGDDHRSSTKMTMGKNTNTKVEYSINLWAEMVDDYARHYKMDDVVLMGNSLGSLVALSVATGDFIESSPNRNNNNNKDREFAYLALDNLGGERSRVRGVCLFNCAVGLNSMNILKNSNFSAMQRIFFQWIFGALNYLIFDNEILLKFALKNVVTKELLRDALRGLYTFNQDKVDDDLVDSFYYPAKLGGDGAVEAIRQIYTNDAGMSPMELHEKYPEILDSMPIHLVWGLDDVVTPIEGDVGKFYCDRVANNRGGKSMTTIDVVKAGHLLFDDNPSDTNNAMMRWIEKKVL